MLGSAVVTLFMWGFAFGLLGRNPADSGVSPVTEAEAATTAARPGGVIAHSDAQLYLTPNAGTAPAFSMNVHLPSAHTARSISMRLSCTYCSGESPIACR